MSYYLEELRKRNMKLTREQEATRSALARPYKAAPEKRGPKFKSAHFDRLGTLKSKTTA